MHGGGDFCVSATTFTLVNKCKHAVWPAIQPSAGNPVLAKGGLHLLPHRAVSIPAPAGWSGRLWGRHGCSFDRTGKGSCATGDCGSGLFCNGAGGAPPATLAEFTLGTQDYYDVSLVDGYNLPIAIAPRRGTGKCTYAGCISDLNASCPPALQVKSKRGEVVACKSACFAFSTPQYCCTGSYGNPQTCRPTSYSRVFKNACPRAYSYAYDDPNSLATCAAADYLITFCPH
ncbi:thaumatin-like protein isoform X2 [Cryptomeria japonica]|uniref:thaumatin-like protein isoform X2 n=1 Tax=Cryptomeria japonica TaxID=3369 RepID=UPI0027DA5897|nr:thaumatin-like protein isoform X2 [Cryptomeria japonica]